MEKTLVRRVSFPTRAGEILASVAGPEDGPVVILLHGFPEFWYGWRHQIPAFALAGYRVIAPDQRGYNESSKPQHVRDYRLAELRSDVIAIADKLGQERVRLVGHDWGGIVAWNFAMHHPHRIARMAILNAPHPAAAQHQLRSNVMQMLRSWYIAWFQVPFAPEWMFSTANFQAGVRALTASSAPGTFSRADLAAYRGAWSQPGAPKAMINWYRAAARYSRPEDVAATEIQVPTRILWGVRDRFVGRELASESVRLCRDGDLVEFATATHWLQHERPDEVNAAILDWFDRR